MGVDIPFLTRRFVSSFYLDYVVTFFSTFLDFQSCNTFLKFGIGFPFLREARVLLYFFGNQFSKMIRSKSVEKPNILIILWLT